MEKRYRVDSPSKTRDLAEGIAQEILDSRSHKGAQVVALSGELGAGKTTFTQALAKSLGVTKRVLSPTFLVMKRFPLPQKNPFKNLYHIDAYRVQAKDLRQLGVEEILQEPNIVVVEWADKVKGILPKGTLWLRFKHGNEPQERQITINRR